MLYNWRCIVLTKEIKSFNFEVKATGENEFEGYASVFRNVDSYRDVIEPGAFTKTIQENKRIKVLWQHDPYMPIGKPTVLQEDNHGLYVKAKISETEEGKRAMILMRDGVIDELSIGFNTIKDAWDNEQQVRRIQEVKLWEFSPVTFAANDMATITGVKNHGHDVERLLFNLNQELKAGKVLSEKNTGLVKSAIDALQALLSATEGKGEPPGAGTHLAEDEEKAANDIMNILKTMKEWGGK
jgi:HK97 family phage prohead protease